MGALRIILWNYLGMILFMTCDFVASVPVLVWNSNGIEDNGPNPLGETTSERLRHILEGFKQENNVVVFMQDVLNSEDFSYEKEEGKHCLEYLSDVMSADLANQSRLYLSNVGSTLQVVQILKELGFIMKVVQAGELKDTIVNSSVNERSLIYVPLPLTVKTGAESTDRTKDSSLIKERCDILGANDRIIREMMELRPNITAIFTAYVSTEASRSKRAAKNKGKNRKQQIDDRSPVFALYASNGTALYASKPIRFVLLNGTSETDLSFNLPISADVSRSQAQNKTILTVDFNDVRVSDETQFKEILWNIHFKRKYNGDWAIIRMTVKLDGTWEGLDIYSKFDLDARAITAPMKFSFHCTNIALKAMRVRGEEGSEFKANLYITGLQFQPFGVQHNKFAESYDCTPLFSATIWSGVVSGIVFGIVLAFGIYMVSSIKTMDRFDVASKGKALIIHASE